MTTLATAAGYGWEASSQTRLDSTQRTMRDSAPSNSINDPDADLMLAVARGDEAALTQLIDRWKGPLISFFFRSVRSQELAEDLAQEVFIRIYRAAPRYRPEAKFSTYLFAIARRRLINEHRRSTRKPLELVDPHDLRSVKSDQSNKQHLFEIE
ncbi:MAG: sigma-70 family RNA polymerase sigma factor, partial [Verrucomicrobiota bacterium]